MRKKALIIATVSGFVPQFEMNNVKILQELGYEVHYASNYHMPSYGKDNSRLDGTGIVRHQIDFVRSPFKIRENWKAFLQLRRLQKQIKFDLVHCHTPMGGVLGRLVFGILGKKKEKIIYTAHGFHFYRGAPLLNWLLCYPVEKFLSRWTDVLVTINRGDYARAKKFRAGTVHYIPGVGIDTSRFCKVGDICNNKTQKLKGQEAQARQELRKRLNIPEDATVFISVGELNDNKNHRTAIDAFAEARLKNSYYLICGMGSLKESLEEHIRKKGISGKVLLLGFCDNVSELLHMSDIFVFPSKREGLGLAALEAMASGLPLIAADVGGIKDYAKDGVTGCCVNPSSVKEISNAMKWMHGNKDFRERCGRNNMEVAKRFDISKSRRVMQRIYSKLKLRT